MLLLACVMCGCKTQYVPVETVRTVESGELRAERVTDSVVNDRFVYVNGDTVIIYKWRDRWHTMTQHDSIYINKTDTISVPYPVEHPLTKWEKLKIEYGGLAIMTTILTIVVLTIYLLRFCYSKKSIIQYNIE